MKYAIDTEFIDTPNCSALISLAIVNERGLYRYFEFEYPSTEMTSWLLEHVVPHLGPARDRTTFTKAAIEIMSFVGPSPEFWCYYGAYDWYWFCRLFGGFMNMPQSWPMRFKEFADIQDGVPNISGSEHNALNDARSLIQAILAPQKVQVGWSR
jgi:hypothetical protein